MPHIVIIGSGPAGCYLADQLLRVLPGASIDILERLPVPFGLIRYGVAPDHQGTKAVSRVLDRLLARDGVGFWGNVEVGRDVQLEELTSLYDAVVLATGAPCDRRLGVPGEELSGVIGSGIFVGWYNGHPECYAPVTDEVRSAVVIGNGNVAIDVARILAKGRAAELAGSDVSPDVASWLEGQPLETIHIVGRRGPADARFTDHELAELGALRGAKPVVDPDLLTGDSAIVRTLRGFAMDNRNLPVSINFHFTLVPAGFTGAERLRGAQFRSPRGDSIEIPAQLAVTCIGYEARSCGTASPSHGVFPNHEGRVREGLYVVGWAKRGPTGTIPTNRVEAQQVAQTIAHDVKEGDRTGGEGLRRLLEQRQVSWVDQAGWRRIDAAELGRVGNDRCRRKF